VSAADTSSNSANSEPLLSMSSVTQPAVSDPPNDASSSEQNPVPGTSSVSSPAGGLQV